jgi:hypothetical protein
MVAAPRTAAVTYWDQANFLIFFKTLVTFSVFSLLVAIEMESSNIPSQKYLKWKITSIYHILEKLGEFNISAQNDVDFLPISLKI